jgi:hypothetical protein
MLGWLECVSGEEGIFSFRFSSSQRVPGRFNGCRGCGRTKFRVEEIAWVDCMFDWPRRGMARALLGVLRQNLGHGR